MCMFPNLFTIMDYINIVHVYHSCLYLKKAVKWFKGRRIDANKMENYCKT